MSITVLGNLGNEGFALPMVQAYPDDVNVAQLLAWSPDDQALAYVPYTGNALGDFGVTRDLSVVRNVNIGGVFQVAAVQVLTARKTGWTAASGTAARTTFDTATVTVDQLAQRVKALMDDLISHGMIGA